MSARVPPDDRDVSVLDRLREMYGIDATDAAGVFDAIEKYDAHMQRNLTKFQTELAACRETIIPTLRAANDSYGREIAALRRWQQDACDWIGAVRKMLSADAVDDLDEFIDDELCGLLRRAGKEVQ